jgi:hypothetical protein
MKTTLKERLNTASSAIQTQGKKGFKHPITSILSLCLVAGIAATIAGFSQAPTEKNVALSGSTASVAAPAGTTPPLNLPVAHTLTSADGRTIDVTILSKSDTAIKAKKADGKEFEIGFDKLSDADRAFVAGLVNPDPNVVKKPTVLVVVDRNYKYPEYSEFIEWLKAENMEVTIGLLYDDSTMDAQLKTSEIPNTKKVVIAQPSVPDTYDIVWIPNFISRVMYKDKYPIFEITNHLLKTKRIMVVSACEAIAQLKYLVSNDIIDNSTAYNRGEENPQNFVKSIDKVVFYDDKVKPYKNPRLSEQKTREKLIKTVNALLTK